MALDNLMLKANVEVFFDTHIQDIIVKDRKIKRIIVSKEILSVYNEEIESSREKLSVSIGARYVIDATGDCRSRKTLRL